MGVSSSFYGISAVISLILLMPAQADEQIAELAGCFFCHRADRTGPGPSFPDIAARYRGNSESRDYLVGIVKNGGKGQWISAAKGTPMPPYSPRMSDDNIEKLVEWILEN